MDNERIFDFIPSIISFLMIYHFSMLEDSWEKAEQFFNTPFIGFIVLIFLYMISFMFLYKEYSNAQYLIWIFMFLLNVLFPLIWIKEVSLFKPNPVNTFGSTLLSYRVGSLFITFLLTFVAILLIILKNDMIRERKLSRNEKEFDLRTNIYEADHKYIQSLDIFTNIIAFSFAIVISMFQDYVRTDSTDFMIGTSMKSVISFSENAFKYMDYSLMYYSKPLPFSPIVKSLFAYIVTFIIVFFGLFIRIRNDTSEFNRNLQDPYEIYNMSRLFPSSFVENIAPLRRFVIFVVVFFFATIPAFIVSLLYSSFVKPGFFETIFMLIYSITFCFGLIGIYVNQLENQYDINSIIKFILSFISILLGFNATVPLLGILQLIVETFMRSSLNTKISGTSFTYVSVFFFLFWIIISSTMYDEIKNWGPSFDNGMETRSEKTELKLVLALLVTMCVSLFIGLGVEYPMFSILYYCFSTFFMNSVRYLAPLLIVILSVIMVVFTNRSYIIVKNVRGEDDQFK